MAGPMGVMRLGGIRDLGPLYPGFGGEELE